MTTSGNAQFIGDQFRLYRSFSQNEGYGSSIAPESIDAHSTVTVTPTNAAFQNDPTVLVFFDSPSVSPFVQIQEPTIRRGSQVPTQNLIGLYGVSLELAWERSPAAAGDLEAAFEVLTESVLEVSIASDRQFMARGGYLLNQVGSTPASTAANDGIGAVRPCEPVLIPSCKIIMPGSTITTTLTLDGSGAPWQAIAGNLKVTAHLHCFNARR